MLAAVLAAAMTPAVALAATGPKVGPKDSWDDMQKFEYYIGQLGGALNLCNFFDLANQMQELANLTPYGKRGWNSLLAFDDIRGGRCNSYADSARKVLKDRERLIEYLGDKYN